MATVNTTCFSNPDDCTPDDALQFQRDMASKLKPLKGFFTQTCGDGCWVKTMDALSHCLNITAIPVGCVLGCPSALQTPP